MRSHTERENGPSPTSIEPDKIMDPDATYDYNAFIVNLAGASPRILFIEYIQYIFDDFLGRVANITSLNVHL